MVIDKIKELRRYIKLLFVNTEIKVEVIVERERGCFGGRTRMRRRGAESGGYERLLNYFIFFIMCVFNFD